jgi:hypothetical protein
VDHLPGARQFRAIRSYLSTAAKHGPGFFDALVMLAEGEPWIPCHRLIKASDIRNRTGYRPSYFLAPQRFSRSPVCRS